MTNPTNTEEQHTVRPDTAELRKENISISVPEEEGEIALDYLGILQELQSAEADLDIPQAETVAISADNGCESTDGEALNTELEAADIREEVATEDQEIVPPDQEAPAEPIWVTTTIAPESERFASKAQRQKTVSTPQQRQAGMAPILYEDNHLLIVNKPSNMPTQQDNSKDMDLFRLCKEDLRVRHNKPGEAYLGLVHRLDRPVGGVVALAKTSKAAARLSQQLRNKEMSREYLAVVVGEPRPGRGELRDFLYKDKDRNMVRVVPRTYPDCKYAILEYVTLATKDGLSLLRVRILTGRAHQIRVQLAHAGTPIWGDQRYGLPYAKPGMQIALWANRLTLTHPTTRQRMQFISPAPEGSPWSLFADILPAR